MSEFEGFDWDDANIQKNWIKHRVTPTECEQLFFNKPLQITDDSKHPEKEKRYYALGHTNEDRYLFIVFTSRDHLIRVILARSMNRKESLYKQL